MFCAAQFFDAANAQRGGGVAFDARAHFTQHFDQVGDLRFARGVVENGFAFGECRGHQNIFGSGYRDFFESDIRAFEAAVIGYFSFDVAVRGGDHRSHFFKRGEMQVDGARADGTTAGKRNASDADAGDQRAKSEDGGAHGLDQFIGSHSIVERGGLDDVIAGGKFRYGNCRRT